MQEMPKYAELRHRRLGCPWQIPTSASAIISSMHIDRAAADAVQVTGSDRAPGTGLGN
jgi:hypothetical protein